MRFGRTCTRPLPRSGEACVTFQQGNNNELVDDLGLGSEMASDNCAKNRFSNCVLVGPPSNSLALLFPLLGRRFVLKNVFGTQSTNPCECLCRKARLHIHNLVSAWRIGWVEFTRHPVEMGEYPWKLQKKRLLECTNNIQDLARKRSKDKVAAMLSHKMRWRVFMDAAAPHTLLIA